MKLEQLVNMSRILNESVARCKDCDEHGLCAGCLELTFEWLDLVSEAVKYLTEDMHERIIYVVKAMTPINDIMED